MLDFDHFIINRIPLYFCSPPLSISIVVVSSVKTNANTSPILIVNTPPILGSLYLEFSDHPAVHLPKRTWHVEY